MSQSKTSSLVEAILNQLSGFIFSLLVWAYVIVPLYDFELNWKTNFEITIIFTVLSIARSYCWRRLFNKFKGVL